jgi:sugar phosphate isomerase/epimerase
VSADVSTDRPIDLGIFARVFPVQPAASLAATVHDLGFSSVQLNLVALGLPSIPTPDQFADVDVDGIARDFRAADVAVWGVSATYNMAHPDPATRARQTAEAANLIRRSPELGATAVSLCTGSRDPDNQWRAHPDNDTPQAWVDMLDSFDTLLAAAEDAGVYLAVEPEPANVVRGADQGVQLLADLADRGKRVGFILDPANLVAGQDPARRSEILRDAFARLGEQTICLHAKDAVTWTERLAGAPGLDFAEIFELHRQLPVAVPVIIQDTEPDEVAAVRDLLLAAAADTR